MAFPLGHALHVGQPLQAHQVDNPSELDREMDLVMRLENRINILEANLEEEKHKVKNLKETRIINYIILGIAGPLLGAAGAIGALFAKGMIKKS